MNCVVIDDEPLAVKGIEKHIEKTKGLVLKNSFQNAFEALYYVQTQDVDLVFLDIQMPGVSGLQFIKILKFPPKIIITSAYREHALEALQLGVIDYLLKPISYQKFLEAVSKAIEKEPARNVEVPQESGQIAAYFFVKQGSQYVKLNIGEILFIRGDRNYSIVNTKDQTYVLNGNLSRHAGQLASFGLMRVHKSYIVATEKIEKYDPEYLWVGDHRIPIGRTYKQNLMRMLKKWRW